MEDWKAKLGATFNIEMPVAEEAAEPAARGDACQQQGAQVVHVLLDRKGRHGKQATLVTDLLCDGDALAALARELKQLCGVGGSARGGEILIQGDQRDKLTAYLKQKGFKVK
ncbi:MAG: translation initiation factor [Muribaculaceae bacterium]|nr:translation initiation factor [Muribaculaceae bacterium]